MKKQSEIDRKDESELEKIGNVDVGGVLVVVGICRQ